MTPVVVALVTIAAWNGLIIACCLHLRRSRDQEPPDPPGIA